jgi:hypothetical protein
MSEQSVMATPIFDELVNELGSQPEEPVANEPQQDGDQQHGNR